MPRCALHVGAERVGNPLIQAFPFGSGGGGDARVQFRCDADVELSRVVPPRFNVIFLAHLKEYLERRRALLLETGNVPGVEVRAAVQTYELAPEHLDIGVELNDGLIAADLHGVLHGLTPFRFSQSRMLATAPLSVLGEGYGR